MNLRQCHVGAGIQGHLDDCCTINVHLFAGRSVAAGHPASLVKSMRLHAPCIIGNKHLQDHRLIHPLQLCKVGNIRLSPHEKVDKELVNQ